MLHQMDSIVLSEAHWRHEHQNVMVAALTRQDHILFLHPGSSVAHLHILHTTVFPNTV